MKPHEQRVVDEKAELDLRTAKLAQFNCTPMFRTLPVAEQHRLLRQAGIMIAYSEVLAERIANFPKEGQ